MLGLFTMTLQLSGHVVISSFPFSPFPMLFAEYSRP